MRRSWVATLLAVVLMASACGGGDSGTEPASTAVGSETGGTESTTTAVLADPGGEQDELGRKAIEQFGGFSEALVAIFLAADDGYDGGQIAAGIESGGLQADGSILDANDDLVLPNDAPTGLMPNAYARFALISLAQSNDEDLTDVSLADVIQMLSEIRRDELAEIFDGIEQQFIDEGLEGEDPAALEELEAWVVVSVVVGLSDDLPAEELIFLIITRQLSDRAWLDVAERNCTENLLLENDEVRDCMVSRIPEHLQQQVRDGSSTLR